MNKILILVVEDDRPVRNLIVTTLKTHDYKYLTAENGTTAIMEASSHQPDIILLDLGLPDMEGVDVIKKIRTWSNVPIIVISARSEDADKIEALDAGALKELLLPMATVLTPNIPETEVLSGMEVKTADDMIAAAKYISETYHCAVLCKGGHQLNDANDLLYRNGDYKWFNGKRIDNPNTHGTGCTLSSAIASNLAKGYDLDTAVERAKAYISGALAAMLDLGQGSGPMDHGFDFRGKGFAEEKA